MGHGQIANDKTRISLVIPKDLKEDLERIAKEENRTLSNFIVTVLKDAVKDK